MFRRTIALALACAAVALAERSTPPVVTIFHLASQEEQARFLAQAATQLGYGGVAPTSDPEAMIAVRDLAGEILVEESFRRRIELGSGEARVTGGEEVWNQPLRRASAGGLDETRKGVVVDRYTGAEVWNQSTTKFMTSDGEATSFTWAEDGVSPGVDASSRTLSYTLCVKDGRVIGEGTWANEAQVDKDSLQPDFIWAPGSLRSGSESATDVLARSLVMIGTETADPEEAETNFNSVPRSGRATTVAWPGYFWSYFNGETDGGIGGGLAWGWNNTSSPAEKFDKAFGPRIASDKWWGICHGAAPAKTVAVVPTICLAVKVRDSWPSGR